MQKWCNAIGQDILLIGIICLQACAFDNFNVDERDPAPDKKEKQVEPNPSVPTLDKLIELTNDLIQARKNNNESVNQLEPTLPNVLGNIKRGALDINDRFGPEGSKLVKDAKPWFTLLTFVAECPQLSESLRLQCLQYAKAQRGDFKVFGSQGGSLLHSLIVDPDPAALKWMLEHTEARALINTRSTDSYQETPLEMAVFWAVNSEQYSPGKLEKRLQIVELLLLQRPIQPIDFERKVRNAESRVGAATQTRALLHTYGKL